MRREHQHDLEEVQLIPDDALPDEGAPARPAAWEEVAAGRYMPRRIKGNCKGRALG